MGNYGFKIRGDSMPLKPTGLQHLFLAVSALRLPISWWVWNPFLVFWKWEFFHSGNAGTFFMSTPEIENKITTKNKGPWKVHLNSVGCYLWCNPHRPNFWPCHSASLPHWNQTVGTSGMARSMEGKYFQQRVQNVPDDIHLPPIVENENEERHFPQILNHRKMWKI